jgi:hypothetical protein
MQHAWYGCAVQRVHRHGRLEVCQRGLHLPALAGAFGEVGHTVDRGVEPRRDQGELTGPEVRRAEALSDLSAHQGLWPGRKGCPGEPQGTGLRLPPRHELVMDATRCAPAGSWHACDGRCPPPTWPGQGPTGREIPDLSGADAPHGVHARLDEQGEMGVATQAPIGPEPIVWWSARMHRLHPGTLVGQQGRDDPLAEHTRAGMEQAQPARHGNAAPRLRLRRRAEGGRQGQGIGHGPSRAIDHTRAMALPPPVVHGGALYRTAEALEQKVTAAPRECGTSLTGGRRTAPQA